MEKWDTMFSRDEHTSNLIAFINSVYRMDKQNEYKLLLEDAIEELSIQVPLMAMCYK